MIRLIRSSDSLEILLNADNISSYLEEGSTTLIKLCDGECIEVKNKATDVMEKIDAWQSGRASDEENTIPLNPQEV